MNGIKQLFKGIVIGVVLLLAIIGLLNISGKNNDKVLTDINNANKPGSTNNAPSTQNGVEAPSINIRQPEAKQASNTNDNGTENQQASDAKTNTAATQADSQANNNTDGFKPEIIEQAATYGTIRLEARLLGNNNPTKVNFSIYDENNKRVASSNDSSSASFRLKTGQYKAIAQLSGSNGSGQNNNDKQAIALDILVEKDKAISKTFHIKPRISTGILQVSAVLGENKQAIKTDFIIQDLQGKRVALRQHVSSTLFKLKSGSYKIIAKSNGLSDVRTINIEPGSSNKEVFHLSATANTAEGTPTEVVKSLPAKILLRALDENTNTLIKANFIITQKDGKLIKRFNAASTAELSLAAGDYQIQATGPNGQASKNITLEAGQTVSETFRFKTAKITEKLPQADPEPDTIVEKTATQNPKAPPLSDNKESSDVVDSAEPETPPQKQTEIRKEVAKAQLRLKTVDSETKKPVKSNFYVQTLNGKHIVNKIYADTASFTLDKGIYKITVKSRNRKTISKTVSVDKDSHINRIFSMALNQPVKPKATTPAPVATINKPQTTPEANEPYYQDRKNPPGKPVKTPGNTIPPNGSLLVAMYPAKNHKTSRNSLLSIFLINTKSGKRIATITGVQHAKVKLDVGDYVVTAIHKNKKRSAPFKIRENQNTIINFNAADFRPVLVDRGIDSHNNRNRPVRARGMLKSRVIDQNGRPLKANLFVTNRKGKVVRRANNVSSANFELPAKAFTIRIDYHGLKGSESVNIIPGETTIQTFTISQ